jgi:competence protein ComEA
VDREASVIAWLNRNPYLVVALAGVLLLAGLGARELLRPQPAPVIAFGQSGPAPGTPIRVHVAGAVVAPGVYELAAGQRVEDAVQAAGGAVEGADLDAINLARRLRDGEQILVPGPPGAPAAVLTPGVALDLNVATREQLDALPGIGEAYSQRILDSRTVDGPFASVDDLLDRGVLPARTLEGIRAMVTVSAP